MGKPSTPSQAHSSDIDAEYVSLDAINEANSRQEPLDTVESEGDTLLDHETGAGATKPAKNCTTCRKTKYAPENTSFLAQSPYLLSVFISIGYDQQVMSLALPQLSTLYNVTSSQVQWVITAFYIANAATSVLSGHLGDIIGPIVYTRILALIAVALYIIAIFMPNLSSIVFIRVLLGYTASGIVACKNAITKSLSPPSKLQKYLMWQINAVNIVAVFIPLIGGELVDYVGWQSIFAVCSNLSLLTAITAFIIPNPYKRRDANGRGKLKFDVWGTIILTLAVTCFCLCFSFLAENSLILMSIFVALTVAFTIAFYFVEKRVSSPIIVFKALRNPMGAITFLYVASNIIASGYTITLPFLFNRVYGLNSLGIGLINGSSCILRIVASSVTPYIDKKIVRRHILSFTFNAAAISTIACTFFLKTHIAFPIMLQMSQTFLLAIAGTLLFPMMLTTAPKKYFALMNGLPTMSRTMGSSIGNALFAAIQNFILLIDYGQSESTTEQDPYYIQSYVYGCQVSLIVLALFSIVTGIVSIFCIRNPPNEEKKWLFKVSQIPKPWDSDEQEGM